MLEKCDKGWLIIDASCQEFFNQSGQIENRINTNGNYFNNVRECWLLKAPKGMAVKYQFSTLLTEKNRDVITIYDGPNSDSRVITKASGYVEPATEFYGKNDVNLIRFQTDNGIHYKGFTLQWQVVDRK